MMGIKEILAREGHSSLKVVQGTHDQGFMIPLNYRKTDTPKRITP
jgi:hypothetical protein